MIIVRCDMCPVELQIQDPKQANKCTVTRSGLPVASWDLCDDCVKRLTDFAMERIIKRNGA